MTRRLNERDRSHVRVTDELLSAYIDGEVTPAERAAVEQAIARDPELAFRLRALQQTVASLSELPRVPLPRAFTLSEADVAPSRGQPFWRRWRDYTLSLYLRGATAVAATLLIVLLVGDAWWSQQMPILFDRTVAPAASIPVEVQSTQLAEEVPAAAVEVARAPAAAVEAPLEKMEPTVLPGGRRLPAEQLAPKALAPEKPAPEAAAVAEEPAAPPVAEAMAVPAEVTPAPEVPVEAELEEEQPAPPPASGMIEPPGPEAPGVFTGRGGGEPVPPGMGGGGGEGGIGEPGAMIAAAERAYAPLPETPMDEGEPVTVAEAIAPPTPTNTPSPTATPSPTPTPTLTGTLCQATGLAGSPTMIPTATPMIVPTATPVPSTPTPAPVAMAPTVALAAAPAPVRESRVQMPLAQPGPFGLSLAQTRALEAILGAAVVILGVASWLTRRR